MAQRNGKYRLILDMSWVNTYIMVPKFKFERIPRDGLPFEHTLGDLFRAGDDCFTVDLKSGYSHLDIHPEFVKFFGFAFEGKYYEFQSLPFGLASAPWAFTQLMKEFVRPFRRLGYRLKYYIDDSLWAANVTKIARTQRTVLARFAECGLYVNFDKCCLHRQPEGAPSTRFVPGSAHRPLAEFIGYAIDLARSRLRATDAKLARTIEKLETIIADAVAGNLTYAPLESAVGALQDLVVIFGRELPMYTFYIRRAVPSVPPPEMRVSNEKFDVSRRDRERAVATRQAEVSRFKRARRVWVKNGVDLNPLAISELRFWSAKLRDLRADPQQGVPIWCPPPTKRIRVWSDAAGVQSDGAVGGWGAWIGDERIAPKYDAHGRFTLAQSVESSLRIELLAFLHGLESLRCRFPRGAEIHWYVDNMGVMWAWNKGRCRASREDHELLEAIFRVARDAGVNIYVAHVPREENEHADWLSKRRNAASDWMLHPRVFASLGRRWGTIDIDLFASHTNHQLPRFYSFYHTPGCAGVDAFAFDWPRHPRIGYANPPFRIIAKVIEHARRCRAKLILIVPDWRTSWAHLLGDFYPGDGTREEVVDAVRLTARRDLFLPGDTANERAVGAPRWDAWAVLLDFRNSHFIPS